MRAAVRLVPVRFIPDGDGGRWEPAAHPDALRPWLAAWDAGITEAEAREGADYLLGEGLAITPKLRRPFVERASA